MQTRQSARTTDGEPLPATPVELARVIAEVIARHDAARADSSGGSGGIRRRMGSKTDHEVENPIHGCSYKTFMACKP